MKPEASRSFRPDAPARVDDLIPKPECAKCGGKVGVIIYTLDTSPNAYGKAKAWR
jgi:hypothetical protein